MFKYLETLDYGLGNSMYAFALDLKDSDRYAEDMMHEFYEYFNDFEKASNAIQEMYDLVWSLDFYKDSGKQYIQLSADQIMFNLDHLKLTNADYNQLDISQQFYLDDARFEFQQKTCVEVYLLGRSGRHVCVDNTFENAIQYEELCDVQSKMQDKYVEDIEKLAKELTKGR